MLVLDGQADYVTEVYRRATSAKEAAGFVRCFLTSCRMFRSSTFPDALSTADENWLQWTLAINHYRLSRLLKAMGEDHEAEGERLESIEHFQQIPGDEKAYKIPKLKTNKEYNEFMNKFDGDPPFTKKAKTSE